MVSAGATCSEWARALADVAAAVPLVCVVESHISGVGLVNTVWPAGSVAVTLPVSVSVDTDSPTVLMV